MVASDIDWQMVQTTLAFDAVSWGRPPKRGPRDIGVKDGDVLTLGDTTLTFDVTPGHTLGTLSPMFDVRANGHHPGSDGTVEKVQLLQTGAKGGHPFVGGQASVDRGLQVLGECAKAQRDRFLSGS